MILLHIVHQNRTTVRRRSATVVFGHGGSEDARRRGRRCKGGFAVVAGLEPRVALGSLGSDLAGVGCARWGGPTWIWPEWGCAPWFWYLVSGGGARRGGDGVWRSRDTEVVGGDDGCASSDHGLGEKKVKEGGKDKKIFFLFIVGLIAIMWLGPLSTC